MRFQILSIMVLVTGLSACGTKPPSCESPETSAALQQLFTTKTAEVFTRYLGNIDPFRMLAIIEKIKFGMGENNRTVLFPPGEAEKLKWSFTITGLVTENKTKANCLGRATFARDDVREGFDFKFVVQTTDNGGAYVTLVDQH
jgi:hypothetical protein